MKRTIITLVALLLGLSITLSAQPSTAEVRAAMAKFPGVSEMHMTMLLEAKKVTPLPLPTWIPEGFRVEDVKLRLGSQVEIQDKVLMVVYSKKLPDGGVQRFALEAGFDGLGDLMYEPTKIIRSGIGEIILIYEPKDDDGMVQNEYVMTEWFRVGKTDFHYIGMYGFNEEGDKSARMISMDDTVKILTSLKRL
jgi:hypothetical protein